MVTKPNLYLLPTAYKAGKVYSVLPADGVGDFDFSRATTATRINKDGLIETVGSNIPRLNYPMIDGVVSGCPSLLLEPQRTNLFTHSEDFSNTSWNKGNLTVIANQAISPDGSQNADEITPDATTGTIRIWQTKTTSTTTYSLSFFVKYNGKQYVQLLFGSLFNSVDFSNFDLINGTVTLGTGEIESYGNGWYKISLTASLNAATDQVYLWSIDSATSSRGASSTGNGSDGLYIWGAQLEEQSYATSYIPTNGSTVTRDAETCTGAGDVNTFNDSEGVLFAEISALVEYDTIFKGISLNDGSVANLVLIYTTSALNSIRVVVQSNSVNQFDKTYVVPSLKDFNKVALKYKANDFSFWVNGIEIDSQLSGSTPIGLNSLDFDEGTGTEKYFGSTKQIQYFPTALNDSDLETFTSWTSFSDMATAQLYSII